MFEGKKTYISLAVVLLGYFGFAELISQTELAASVDSVLQLIGVVGAVYGRIVARPK